MAAEAALDSFTSIDKAIDRASTLLGCGQCRKRRHTFDKPLPLPQAVDRSALWQGHFCMVSALNCGGHHPLQLLATTELARGEAGGLAKLKLGHELL